MVSRAACCVLDVSRSLQLATGSHGNARNDVRGPGRYERELRDIRQIVLTGSRMVQ